MEQQKKRYQQTEYILCIVLCGILAAVTCYLTYQQAFHAWNGSDQYHSDVLAYMKEAKGIDSGYSFPYPIMFLLIRTLHFLIPIEWSVAIVLTSLQCISFILLRYYLQKYLGFAKNSAITGWKKCFVTLAAFFALFYSMIFIYNHPMPGLRFYYMGVFSPNPFHNATYIASRPFGIISFFMFTDLLDCYEEKTDIKKYIGFSLILLLTTMTKPSFTIVFCGVAGLIMLFRLCKRKGSNLKSTILLGCTFIPTFVDLLYQFGGVFSGTDSKGEEAGIGFGLFKVWTEYCDNYPVAIMLMIFFPLIVLLFQYRKLKFHTVYRLGWQMYGMSLLMFVLLYEKGFRRVDANFSWGYMLGGFFLVIGSLLVLLEDTEGDKWYHWKLLIQWAAFGLHVACGLLYFLIIITGGSYY